MAATVVQSPGAVQGLVPVFEAGFCRFKAGGTFPMERRKMLRDPVHEPALGGRKARLGQSVDLYFVLFTLGDECEFTTVADRQTGSAGDRAAPCGTVQSRKWPSLSYASKPRLGAELFVSFPQTWNGSPAPP